MFYNYNGHTTARVLVTSPAEALPQNVVRGQLLPHTRGQAEVSGVQVLENLQRNLGRKMTQVGELLCDCVSLLRVRLLLRLLPDPGSGVLVLQRLAELRVQVCDCK